MPLDTERKTAIMHFKVSYRDSERIKQSALDVNETLSSFMRRVVLNETERIERIAQGSLPALTEQERNELINLRKQLKENKS